MNQFLVAAKKDYERFAQCMRQKESRKRALQDAGVILLVFFAIDRCPAILLIMIASLFPNMPWSGGQVDWHRDKILTPRLRKLIMFGIIFFAFIAGVQFLMSWTEGIAPSIALFGLAAAALLALATLISFAVRRALMLSVTLLERRSPAITNSGITGSLPAACATRRHAWPARLSALSRISWYEGTYYGLLGLLSGLTTVAVCKSDSLGEWLANWLISSALDANIITDVSSQGYYYLHHTAFDSAPFFLAVKAITTFALLWALSRPFSRLAHLLTTAADRLAHCPHPSRFWEASIDALRVKSLSIYLKPKTVWLRDIALTFWWLAICYSVLFSLVAFAPGPLGLVIRNWLTSSLRDANILHVNLFNSMNMRLFVAAIVAMFGTVPVAIMSCSFLPRFRPKELKINSDGLLYPPCLSMLFRPFRIWADVRKVYLSDARTDKPIDKNSLVISFRTGGFLKLPLAQMGKPELAELLATLDEYADSAVIGSEVIALRTQLSEQNNKSQSALSKKFKSTIFVPLKIGHVIADRNIRIVRLLTSKPLSAVYLVRLPKGELGVLKQLVLPSNSAETERARENFKREYELLNRLDHPSISKVLSVFETEESNFLLLEHNRGEDLQSLVERHGPRRELGVREWARQIAEILLYLHSQNPPIIHRDLTPDNLVIDENDRLKLIDFGAAHQFLEGVTGTLIGKQCYVAPEQLRGKASIRSDIYSFGATLYYLLTGKEPRALSQCDVREHTHLVSNTLADLIKDCTEFDEEKRPASFEELLSRLNCEYVLPERVVEILLEEPPPSKQSAFLEQPAPESQPSVPAAEPQKMEEEETGQSVKIDVEIPVAVKVESA